MPHCKLFYLQVRCQSNSFNNNSPQPLNENLITYTYQHSTITCNNSNFTLRPQKRHSARHLYNIIQQEPLRFLRQHIKSTQTVMQTLEYGGLKRQPLQSQQVSGSQPFWLHTKIKSMQLNMQCNHAIHICKQKSKKRKHIQCKLTILNGNNPHIYPG